MLVCRSLGTPENKSRKASARLLRRLRHPQEKCLGNVFEFAVRDIAVLTVAVQGPAEPQQDVSIFSFLKIHFSGGLHSC